MNEFGFILKKFITFFIEPFGFIIFGFAVGLFLLFRKKEDIARYILSVVFIVLVVFSYPPVAIFLVKGLENQYKPFNYNEKPKYIHVLGGGDGKRVREGVKIHEMIKGSKLIFTGAIGVYELSTAQINTNLALSLGVKKEDIILSDLAKDTREEATFDKTLVKNNSFVLVSTATHVPRAMMIFESLGLKPIAAPTDFFKEKGGGFLRVPSLKSLKMSSRALHEYVGILWLRVRN